MFMRCTALSPYQHAHHLVPEGVLDHMSFLNILRLNLLLLIILLGNSACIDTKEKKHDITVNSWIGYTPLMYVHEKGLLQDLPFNFIFVSSLGESLKLYRNGLSSGFASTQYEAIRTNDPHIKPVILLDRSAGADLIMSNRTLQQIKEAKEPLQVYLEKDSVNYLLFQSFIKKHQLRDKQFTISDVGQLSLEVAPLADNPNLVITYEPFGSTLKEHGLHVIDSTKDLNLLVLDALFIKDDIFKKEKESFVILKKHCFLAITQLKNNPREYYETVQPYLQGQNFADFIKSSEQIEWLLDKPVPDNIIEALQNNHLDIDLIIQP